MTLPNFDTLDCGSRLPALLNRCLILGFTVFSFVVTANAQPTQSLTELEMVGRYAELEKAAQGKLNTQGKPNTSVLAPLCLAYSKLKRYNKIFPCLDELEIQVLSGDTTIETDKFLISNSDASSFANMLRSEAFLEIGDYRRAINEAKTALGRVQDRMPAGVWPAKQYRLSILGILALAYALAGDKENAVIQLRLLEDFPVGFVGNAMQGPLKANAIARVYVALGEYQKALAYVKQDEGAWIRSTWFMGNLGWGFSGDDARETYLVLPKLLIRGKCLLETGNLGEAKASLDSALRNARIRDHGELYWITLFERGRIAEIDKNYNEAIEFYRRAIDVIELQRSSINTEANKIGFVGDKQQVYARLVAGLVELGRASEAFGYVERSKSRALVDILASKKDFAPIAADPEKVRLVLAQLDSEELASHAQDPTIKPGENAALRSLLIARQEIRSTAPELSTLVTVTAVPPDEIKALIGGVATLMEYYYHGNDMYVFVVNRERLQAFKLDATGLVEQVQRFRKAVENPGSNAWQAPAQALYERLWKPFEEQVATKSVTIVAHGVLHYLPFAALQRPDGGFLIDRYELRFLPSASVLKFLRPPVVMKEAQLLALGNPDVGDPKLDLQFAEDEARAVAGIFPDTRVLIRRDASETNFKKVGGFFSRIHFATHGKFQADSPLNSGLYLAKDADNDGVLTVGELYSMNLDADLVVLSACETGLGKITNGDDVVGLTRGFLYAGSRSIVASLWSIDDRATAELMKAFYKNLTGMSKQEALRQAQIRTRQIYPHPVFWAAFQLTGRNN